jgi:hypothetical protein
MFGLNCTQYLKTFKKTTVMENTFNEEELPRNTPQDSNENLETEDTSFEEEDEENFEDEDELDDEAEEETDEADEV